jgi:D-Tyr-tRNAtyr deacylase
VVQKTGPSRVTVDNEEKAAIENGLDVLLGIKKGDSTRMANTWWTKLFICVYLKTNMAK